MTRRDILNGIRQVKQDPDLAGMNATDAESMVIFVTESNQALVDFVMKEVTKAVENDTRTSFMYAFLTAAWQSLNEFVIIFGNYLKARNNKPKQRG